MGGFAERLEPIDAHMRSHTVVAVDGGSGRQQAERTVAAADEDGCRELLAFADGLDGEREWAIDRATPSERDRYRTIWVPVSGRTARSARLAEPRRRSRHRCLSA
jgi:hypothetical protein